eukprot:s2534_g3.t2
MCAESEDEQQLLVRSDSGTLRLVPARPTDTVDRLQSEIQRLGLDPGPLRFFGRHLEGSRTLASYGIGPLSELELCSAGLLGGGQGLFTCQASSASECGVESGSDSSASGSDVESDSAEEDDAENEDAAPSVGEAQDPPGMDSPTSIASQPLEGFADPDHQVRLYEDWEELQQIEFLLRYITGDEAARGHIPRRLGRPIVAGPGSDGSRLSSLFSMGPFPDMAITAMLTDHAAFDGFVFTDGPTVRFVPVPMRLRLEPLAPFDVDALGYEALGCQARFLPGCQEYDGDHDEQPLRRTHSVPATATRVTFSQSDDARRARRSVRELWCRSYNLQTCGNHGSIGHPHICGAICRIFQSQGSCTDGDQCECCHRRHPPAIRMDKHQRRIIQDLGGEDIGSLVFGTLAERLTAMQMPSSITVEARKFLHYAFSLSSSARPVRMDRHTRNLCKYFRHMSLQQLLGLLRHVGQTAEATRLHVLFREVREQCCRASASIFLVSTNAVPRELLDTLENAGPSSTEGKKCGSHFSNCLQAQVSNSFWLLLRCLCQATSQRYASETFQHLLKPDVLLRAVFLKTPEPWKLVHSSLVCCAKGMAVMTAVVSMTKIPTMHNGGDGERQEIVRLSKTKIAMSSGRLYHKGQHQEGITSFCMLLDCACAVSDYREEISIYHG